MKTFSRLFMSLIIVSMLMGVTACSGSDDVARVNDDVITRAEFDAILEMAKAQNPTAFEGSEDTTLMAEYERSLLDTMVQNLLIRQAALAEGAEVTDAEVEEQITSIKSGFADDATFDEALASAGMTMEDLQDNIRDQLLYEFLYNKVAPEVEVTDERVAEYYEENKAMFVTSDQSQLSHILFDLEDEDTAKEVLAELQDGGDFAALAEEYSIDTGSAANGGDLGMASTDMYVTEFKDAADALAKGEMSGLVQSDFGWHIILKVDEQAGGQQTLEEVADSIRSTLLEEGRSEAFATYMDDFEANSDIEILDESLKMEDE